MTLHAVHIITSFVYVIMNHLTKKVKVSWFEVFPNAARQNVSAEIKVKQGTVAHFYYHSKLGNLRKTTKNITGAGGAKTKPCCLNSLLFAHDHDDAGHRVNCTSVLGNGKKE
jgi:hypothetical protein